jgi:large subunit ribosomal protein L9
MKRRSVKLLLTDNVDNLGIVGDVVEVRHGYARNFLLPQGLAITPNPAAIKKLAARREEVERQLREKRSEQEALIAKLAGFELTLKRSANEQGLLFGSVTQHDIALALQEHGFNIVERDVRIGSPIKHLETYTLPIQLAKDLRCEIKVHVESDKPVEQQPPQQAEAQPEQAEGEAPAPERKPRLKRESEAETA